MPPDEPAPARALMSVAIPPQLRPFVELGSQAYDRYPRSRGFRWMRTALRLWYLAFGLYLGNVLFNLFALVAQDGFESLLHLTNLANAFLLTQLLALWAHQPGAVSAIVVILGALILGGRSAHADRERERAVLDLRLRLDEWRQVHETLITLPIAPRSLPQPQGPPFDEALLPVPDPFVGRAADLAWLLARLQQGGATAITALEGLGGIGKTALAAAAVRQLREAGRFPDGIAVVLCQGLTESVEVVRRVLTRFDPYRRAPEADDLPRLTDAARLLLAGKKALVVLDNVEPGLAVAEAVVPLRAVGVTLLLTARQTLPPAAVPVEASRLLDLLTSEEALELFATSMGRRGAADLSQSEDAAAARIVAALDRHTLAVKLAAAYAANARRSLIELAQELEADPIGVPDGETPRAVALMFARSTEALPGDTRRLFVSLAAFATVEFGRRAVIALGEALGSSAPEMSPERSVDLLVFRALLDASTQPETSDTNDRDHDRERLRLHPLLRAFADDLFADWSEAERDIVSSAVASYFARYASIASDRALAADQGNITGAIEWAHAHTQHRVVATLCYAMRQYWRDRYFTLDRLRYLPWGIDAATIIADEMGARDDRMRAARLALVYGSVLLDIGKLDQAEQLLQRTLTTSRELGDQQAEGAALAFLGKLAQLRGHLDQASKLLHDSLSLRRAVHDRQGEAADLSRLGLVAMQRGQFAQAEAFFNQSLPIRRAEDVQDRIGEGEDLEYLGFIAMQRGQLNVAERYLQQALQVAREVHDRQGEGTILSSLGRVEWRRGEQLAVAEDYLQQALRVAREVQDRQGEGVHLDSLGQLAVTQGRLDTAESYFRQALAICEELDDKQGKGAERVYLGQIALLRGDAEAAGAYLQQSLPYLKESEFRRGESFALGQLALVAELDNDLDHAEHLYHESLSIAREIQTEPETADALLALGRFLIERRNNREEGAPMIAQALRHYRASGMVLKEQEAQQIASRLGIEL